MTVLGFIILGLLIDRFGLVNFTITAFTLATLFSYWRG